MSLNKKSLAEAISTAIDSSKADAERAVDTIVETIVKALTDGEEVSIAGLGIFSTKMRKARTARNPRTGEPIQVPEMRVAKFRVAKALKDAVR